jgi:AcrR family transcriptional regulator
MTISAKRPEGEHQVERGARRADSRRKLLDAARSLFVERGYHDTRPQDITKLAGLGHGTFYLHFSDKRDCFLAFVEEARAELDAEVATRTAGVTEFAAQIEASLHAIYHYADTHPGVLATAMTDDGVIAAGEAHEKTLIEKWSDQWAESVKVQMREKRIATDINAQVLGGAIVGLIHQGSLAGQRAGIPRAEIIKNLTRVLVRALAPINKA